MTLRDVATFLLFSNISMGILTVLMMVLACVWFKYMRATQRHSIAIDATYIDPDDRDPDSTLELMKAEFKRLRDIRNIWINRFYWALGAVMVYATLISASSHYLQ